MNVGTSVETQSYTGLSEMDTATATNSDREYFRPGMNGHDPSSLVRPGTTTTGMTAPLANRSASNGGVSSTGLIRLTLKKPMGIVFEPMEDPHNPSQQRGVRICDLPRTGAAAMSGRLEVGDELLSINKKTMSRLTFDEIMDFIIEANAESVDLLFRRPKKDSSRLNSINDSAKGSSVKWVAKDEKVVTEIIEPETDQDTLDTEPEKRHKSSGGKKGKDQKRSHRDEESLMSADDTFYTEATDYTEETRQRRRRSRRSRRLASESFLDMLIDSLCAPIMAEGGRRGGYYSDDDTYADDETYGTYDDDESYIIAKKKKWNERKRREKERQEKAKREKEMKKNVSGDDDFKENIHFPSETNSNFPPQSQTKSSYSGNFMTNAVENMGTKVNMHMGGYFNNEQAPPPPPPPNFNTNKNLTPQSRFEPNIIPSATNGEDSLVPDPNAPFAELEYDDFDHGADVSVMDSIGGPSLLLENLRNANKIVKTVSPELIVKFGISYPQELGLTREESIQVDPIKFYKWVVKTLLEEFEPEKLRLMDKLFEKYKGREEHLIHKLNARYTEEEEEKGKSSEDDGFDAFGGDFSRSVSTTKQSQTKPSFDNNGWPVTIHEGEEDTKEGRSDEEEEFSDDDYESVDGTSPEVIAKVSDLLNYVYGKTTVPGQIDRVSTIMRAYEGRTSVLLELLETKALLKSNADSENNEPLPDSMRDGNNGAMINSHSPERKFGTPQKTPVSKQYDIFCIFYSLIDDISN